MFGYDPDRDPNRFNSDVHYRLYFSPRDDAGAVVICVQDFDYYDYSPSHFIGYQAFATEEEAERALDSLRADAAKILGLRTAYY